MENLMKDFQFGLVIAFVLMLIGAFVLFLTIDPPFAFFVLGAACLLSLLSK